MRLLIIKKYYILLFLTVFISCQTIDKKQNDEQNTQLNISSDSLIATNTQQPDTAISLSFNNDTAYYKKGNVLLVKKYIQPLKAIGGDSINPQQIHDEAFLIANCLILLKNIKTAGHFCNIPEIGTVEVHTPNGAYSVIVEGESKSSSLLGFDFTSNFLGNRFSSPLGNWGLIIIEAEGQLYGFLIIKSNGKIKEVKIDENLYLTGELLKAEFTPKNELVWNSLTDNYAPVKFTINSEGVYWIDKN